MASYSVTGGQRAAYGKTPVASVVDTVAFDRRLDTVRVVNDTGTAAIFVTVDRTTPTVDGAGTYRVRAIAGDYVDIQVDNADLDAAPTVVKLISSGTPTYSVEGAT